MSLYNIPATGSAPHGCKGANILWRYSRKYVFCIRHFFDSEATKLHSKVYRKLMDVIYFVSIITDANNHFSRINEKKGKKKTFCFRNCERRAFDGISDKNGEEGERHRRCQSENRLLSRLHGNVAVCFPFIQCSMTKVWTIAVWGEKNCTPTLYYTYECQALHVGSGSVSNFLVSRYLNVVITGVTKLYKTRGRQSCSLRTPTS